MLSRRQRREIVARSQMEISIQPLSDGDYCAVLIENGTDLYRSKGMPTREEALSLAGHEMDMRVEARVDQIEREAKAEMRSPTEHFGAWA